MPVQHDNDDMKGLVKLLMITLVFISFVLSLAHFSTSDKMPATSLPAKKRKKKHPCLIFWKLWLPLLTCSASRLTKHEYVISIYYWNCVISVYGMTDELRTGQEVWLWSWWCERALAVMFGELGSWLVGWPGKKYTNTHIHAELANRTWLGQLLAIQTVYMCFV